MAFRVITIGAVTAVLLAGCGNAHPGPGTPPPPPVTSTQQPPPSTEQPPPPVASLFDRVSGEGAYQHLVALQRIADDNRGTRVSPGPGYDASVDYVATVLTQAGFEVSTPTFNQDGTQVRQVIAQTRTGDPNRVVFLGAHLDSVPKGPGIDDNGSGVAAMLEIATQLGSSPKTSNAVRFAFWGGEEEGDQGSVSYVKDLSDQERSRILLYINADMVASENGGYFVQGGTGNKNSQTGPAGSATVAQVLVDQLARAGVEADRYQFDGESDYEGFVDAGIPSGGVLTSGDRDSLTEEQAAKWGGEAGGDIAPCYHSKCDDLGHIDKTIMDRFTHALGGATEYFAQFTGSLS